MGIFFGGQIPEKILMFGKILITAYLFGITRDMDAYLVAMTIPTLYLNLFGDTIYIYMLDVFTAKINDLESAWEITNIIITLALLIGIVFSAAYVAAMPLLSGWLSEGLNQSTISLAMRLAVLLAPLYIIYLFQALFKALSESFHLYGISSLQSSFNNGSAIVVLVALMLIKRPDIYGYVVATLISETVAALCYVPQLLVKGFRYRPDFRFLHPEVKKHYTYAFNLTVSSGVFKFYIPINRYFLLFLPVGAISLSNYATNLVQVFSSLLRAFVNAVFPSLTIASHDKDHAEMRRFMEMALRAMALVGIPVMVMFVMLRVPILAMLQRGKFTPEAMQIAANTTGWLAPCLLFFPLLYLQIRMMTVLRRMAALVMIGAAGISLIAILDKIILVVLAARHTAASDFLGLGLYGIALGNTVAMGLMSAVAMKIIWKSVGVINSRLVGTAVFKGAAASAAAGIAIAAVTLAIRRILPASSFTHFAIILLVGSITGSLAAFAAMVALRTQEISDALLIIRRKAGSWLEKSNS